MDIQQQSSSLIFERGDQDEISLITYICENTDGILDPIDQMTYALNETAIKYGPLIILKDAP